VFTEKEKAKFELANRGWSPERREQVASFECNICNRLFREHSWQAFDDCQAQTEAPHVHQKECDCRFRAKKARNIKNGEKDLVVGLPGVGCGVMSVLSRVFRYIR
jgi:hypothetical protein